MIGKFRFCATSSALALLIAAAPGYAQQTAAPAKPKPAQGADEAPKPEGASDTSVSPTAPPAAAQDAPVEGSGDIVVTGLRRSLESAQTIKRTSDGIVDAVVAEDIGKLPDTFASSALQRVAGVNVTRGGGESAGVTVRGLPDLTTTYNGRQIFTAEGRFVAIQDFPAGTVAALEVYKSGTANQIEAGIAGEVNVRGRKPFDFKGFELSGSANGVLSQQSEKIVPNGNLLISDRWNTGIGEIGLLVNVAYIGINFLDSSREQSVVIARTNQVDPNTGAISNNAPGYAAGLRFPDAQGNFLGYGARSRPSANAAFQWKPTPDLEFYADGLFQGFRSKDYNRWMFIPNFGGITLSNITTGANNQITSATVSGAQRPDGYVGSVDGHTDTYQGGAGVNYTHDKLQLSADVAYTNSKFTLNLVNIDYAAKGTPAHTSYFNVPDDGGPSQRFINFDITDPASFVSRGLYQELTRVSGKDWQARADAGYDLDYGFLKRLQVGVRYSDRDAARDFGNIYRNNEGSQIPLASLPGVVVRTTLPGFTFNEAQPNVAFAAITRDSIRANLVGLRAFFGEPAGTVGFDPLQLFRANEKSYAAYAQLKYGFDLGGVTIDGLAGLRAVKTKDRITAPSSIAGVVTTATANNDYTDYLPNGSARIAFSDKLQLRLAYTKTRTRPNFIDLRPNLSVGSPRVSSGPTDPCFIPTSAQYNSSDCAVGASEGNPNLKPLTSNNYDASLEYYFSRTGSLTGDVFRRDVKGFLATVSNVFRDPTLGLINLSQPINLGRTRLQGAELNFTSFLDINGLPDWAKGFGVQANGTYIDAKGDLPPNFAASYNNQQQRFPGVSKYAYNLVGLYEKPQFSARLAYNYRSKFVSYYTFETFDPIAHPTVEQGRGQLDGSLTVTPVPNITVAFDIVNLLGNPIQRDRAYDTGDVYRRQVLYIERSYSLGVRFRF